MRVRIVFDLKNRGATIPYHHQYLLAQFIRGVVLKDDDSRYNSYKLFNFSGLKGQTRISRNGLQYLSRKVTLVLSTLDDEFANHFLNRLFELKTLEIGNLKLSPDLVEIEEPVTFGEKTKFICISPLVLFSPDKNDYLNKKFITPSSDLFSDLLYKSTMLRFRDAFGLENEDLASMNKFQIVPDRDYILRLTRSQKKFARVYSTYHNNVRYELRGYTFPLTLFAVKEVQEFVFTCGLGALTENGFGMLDVANVDPTERIEEYMHGKKERISS